MTAPVTGRLDAVGIVVSDLKRAVDFYRLLGVPFEAGAGDSEHGHAEAVLEGGVRFMLDTEGSMRQFDPGWRRHEGASGATVAFQCAKPRDVDELYRRALESGARAHKQPWDAFWGQRYAQLRDPDGNPIDLYSALEGGES